MLGAEFGRGLWVCEAPREALQRGDLHAWRESVETIEAMHAQPLQKALRDGCVQEVCLEVLGATGSQRFEFTRGDAWKLWRVIRPLARYAA